MISGGFLSAGRRVPAILESFDMLKSSLCSLGAKHSPPGDKFQKSGGPPASGPGPSEIQISNAKSYPNEEFSTATLMIFNVYSDCVHLMF